MTKILFLDIDGVVNCRSNFGNPNFTGVDPKLAELVKLIVKNTKCGVVLSSSWRHSERGKNHIKKELLPFIDITGNCCSGIRGVEIYNWLKEHKEVERYAILDDEGDMLLWQKDNFFQTSFETGITEEIAKAVIEHLNK